MHWAWRALIAVVVGMAWVWLSHSAFGPERINLALTDAHEAAYDVLKAVGVTRSQTVLLVTQIIFSDLIPALVVMATYGLLIRYCGPRKQCPECGERI